MLDEQSSRWVRPPRVTSHPELPRSRKGQEIECSVKHVEHGENACTMGLERFSCSKHTVSSSRLTRQNSDNTKSFNVRGCHSPCVPLPGFLRRCSCTITAVCGYGTPLTLTSSHKSRKVTKFREKVVTAATLCRRQSVIAGAMQSG
jgi:hypothetical protein